LSENGEGYSSFVVGFSAPFVIGGAVIYAPAASSFVGSTVLPRVGVFALSAYKGIKYVAKGYHNTFGKNGGYTNTAWNYVNQSISNNDWTGKSHNSGGYLTSMFTRNDASLLEQTVLGAAGSGGVVSLSFEGKFEGVWSTPGHYSSTTILNGGLLQPFGSALGTRLGLSNGLTNFITNTATGGLQYGIEGTKKW
jgi:hypothetical protein